MVEFVMAGIQTRLCAKPALLVAKSRYQLYDPQPGAKHYQND